jgi:hypothetical protein
MFDSRFAARPVSATGLSRPGALRSPLEPCWLDMLDGKPVRP